MSNTKRLLTEEETAEILRLSRRTLRNYRRLKKGPAFIRLGGSAIRYRFSDIEKYIDNSPRVESWQP